MLILNKSTLLLFCVLSACVCNVNSQTVSYSGYVDSYYATDNDYSVKTDRNRKLGFLDSRKNEFDINIAQLGAAVEDTSFRAKVTLHAGRLAEVTAGTGTWRYMQEAWAGCNIIKSVWIDAGLFLTHVGSEALTPRDNFLSNHSVMTSYQPFYQTGLRCTYKSESFETQLHVLNGYGRFEDNNSDKSIGWLLQYKPNQDWSVTWNGIAGNEQDSTNPIKTRMFNEFVVSAVLSKKVSIRALGDYIIENRHGIKQAHTLGCVIQGHYFVSNKVSVALQFETFDDKDDIVGSGGTEDLLGTAIGVEYKPSGNAYIRIEARRIMVGEKSLTAFVNEDLQRSNSRNECALNIGAWF